MKFLIVVACAFVAASAHVIAPVQTYNAWADEPIVAAAPVYSGPQHIPVIENGVPVETPAVQQAKAEHFAKKAEVHARNGDYAYAAAPVVAHTYAAAPVVAHTYAAAPVVSHTYAAAPVVASTYAAAPVVAAAQPVYTGPQHLPVIGQNGVPVDTPAVQHAKAAHFAQKAEAHARNGDYAAIPAVATTYAAAPVVAAAAQPVYTGPQHIPVIGQNGVPVDTPAVQEAKAEHFARKAEAHARNGDYAVPVLAAAAPVVATTYAKAAPVVASSYATTYTAPAVATYSAPAVATYSAAPAVATYAAAPAVATYAATPAVATYAATPAVATYSAAPAVATYAAAPAVATYAAAPAVATYATAPAVATYSAPAVSAYSSYNYAVPAVTAYSSYNYAAPAVASTYTHVTPYVASTYAHAAPVVSEW